MKLEELHIHGTHRYSSNTGYSASKRVARELTAEIIEQATVPAIEAKP